MPTNNMLPKVSLTPTTFTPVNPTFQVFTPQQADMSLLARSLDKIEERRKDLDNQNLAISKAFSEARQLLPDNEETNNYINSEQDKVSKSIEAMIDVGDMSGALSTARNAAADFIKSPEYNARIKEHRQREEWFSNLEKSNVEQYVKDYYKHLYYDNSYLTRDANGNVTGTSGFKALLPNVGISASALIQQAVKSTADERKDTASDYSKSGDYGGTSSHSSYREEKLTAAKVSETAKRMLQDNPEYEQAFVDRFNAANYKITELTNQLKSEQDPARRKDLENQIQGFKNSYYKNGAPYSSANDYINDLFSENNEEIKNAAYLYKHSNSGGSSSTRNPNLPANGGSGVGYNFTGRGAADLQTTVPGGTINFAKSQLGNIFSGGRGFAPARGNRQNLKGKTTN